ncbi:hypothetical protein Desde_0536 [Desulfitobacterium dehalogenans ATCC 51507]|uniref:Uncharacterized protein n=2 Tax=Desulfitobacterium dehalogenans TaxID=36854 RepID=I4A4W0_DESDJ|nr:hypothetical protein Desde_0536 [Desulfitobacterium dehalogenans ATCC 51507]
MEDAINETYSIMRAVPLTLNSYPLICNKYMQTNRDFFIRVFNDKSQAKELLVVHPGTDRLLPSAIACAAFASVFYGEVNVKEYYRRFNPDQMVSLGIERYRFVGVDGDVCILKSDDNKKAVNSTTRVPLDFGLNIRPNNGSSLKTGTQGSRGSLAKVAKASEYLQGLVGGTYRNQAIVQPLCTLVVCSRDKAQYIMDRMTFIDDEGVFRFADVFPAAWARSVDEKRFYFGEVGKSVPTVLFTNRISLAREILHDDQDYEKRIFAVILDDIESTESASEINDIKELIGRRQNGRIIIIQSADKISDSINAVISDNTRTVVWSPEILLSTIDDLYHQPENPDDRAIMDIINRTIDSSIRRDVVKSLDAFLEFKYCKTFLKKLVHIREKAPDVDEYILCAYGLINLFEQAAFTMDEYERYIESNGVRIRSPQKQVGRLYELADSLSDKGYREDAQLVAIALKNAYKSISAHNFKKDELLRCLQIASDEGKLCGVVVPKKSFMNVIEEICSDFPQVRVILSSRLSQDVVLDRLIITATPNIKRDGFNPLAGKAASETMLLEYGDEVAKNDCYQRMHERALAAINSAAKRSAPEMFGETVDTKSFDTEDQVDEHGLDEIEFLERELTNIETDAVIGEALSHLHSSTTTLRAIRFVQFDTGEWALFSKYYTAYVFDEKEKKLVEKSPIDLLPGDIVIFSADSEKITDFVDDILKRLILRGNSTLAEHYERSKYWKKILNDYMRSKNLTYGDIAGTMKDLGHPRHAVTIGTWLREDSIIVGPRDEDAFIAIGLAADNNEIADHAQLYKESCDHIRSQRIKILNYVQASIIQSVTGIRRSKGQDSLSRDETSYLGDVQKYAKKLTIERIVPCERFAPSHLVNRPFGR